MSINIQNIQLLREQTGAGLLDCKKALIEAEDDIQQAVRLIKATGVELAEKKAERLAADGIAYAAIKSGKAVLLEINTETDFVANNSEFQKATSDIAQTIADNEPNSMEELLQCTCKAQSLSIASLLQKMVVTFRENIILRRFELLTGTYPVAYMHMNGKYGTILNLETGGSSNKAVLEGIGKDLAMQIASMAPEYLSREYVPEAVLLNLQKETRLDIASDKKLSGKPEKVIEQIYQGRINKFMKTHCLLDQPFIKDDSITVGQFLTSQSQKYGMEISVSGYCRYEKAEGIQQ